MKKIKKIVTIMLACTMIMGMTLTASAATPSTVACIQCARKSPVLLRRIIRYEGRDYIYEWFCQACSLSFSTYA